MVTLGPSGHPGAHLLRYRQEAPGGSLGLFLHLAFLPLCPWEASPTNPALTLSGVVPGIQG